MTIAQWIRNAANTLADNMFTSGVLDAEIILAHTLNKPRVWLHAHTDEVLDARHIEIADARLDLRLDHVPVAYIIGHKEFYGRRFTVTPSVLIPRPESEAMIELLGDLLPTTQELLPTTKRLVDIGTGSGCLGITAKLEYPELDVMVCDISNHALTVAKRNIEQHVVDIVALHSDLLQQYPFSPDIILANLPYVDKEWDTPPDLEHEPATALFAKQHGLALIFTLLKQAEQRITPGGLVILEADIRQHQAIINFAKQAGFAHVATRGLALGLKK